MGQESVQVVVAVFNTEEKAEIGLNYLKDLRAEGKIDFEDAAILKRERDGKLRVKETGDMSAGKGAGIGSVLGGVLGLIGGPAGVVVGASAGALVGGIAAHGDTGLSDVRLQRMGQNLEPGMSALVAVVSGEEGSAHVSQALKDEALEVSIEVLEDDLIAQINAGDESAAAKLDIDEKSA